jgi:menaquinone reductase, molybdopterin-binding-like subunit
MLTSRRDLFKFIGGSALGAVFTPVPWRLITDTALWSENWPGIPRPARGEIRTKFTNCVLCPAGCAVRARCVGEQPVSLAGVAGHPLSRGALCPFGLAGHHLPYHPQRLKQGRAEEAAAAVAAAMAKCGPGERIAVLDLRPGRTASWTYRRAMAAQNGLYLTARQAIGGMAVDLAKARTVLSFGVPMLDGWGTPGNVLAARPNFRLIQAEPLESTTASLADLWLRIRPGSEGTLALGLANLLMSGAPAKQFPAEFAAGARNTTAAAAAAATGISEQQITALAHELSAGGALVLAGQNCPEALALNQLTGAWGEALTARGEAPAPEAWKKAAPVAELDSAPDGAIRVLLIDESAPGDYIPWAAIEPKLVRDNPVVVAFAASREGYGRHAHFVLPTAVYPEVLDDIPAPVDSPAAAFRISAPLVAAPAGLVNPSEFIAKAAGIDAGNALRERSDAIHKSGRGALFTYAGGNSTPVKDVKPDDFWKALNEGGCWMDNPRGAGFQPAAGFTPGTPRGSTAAAQKGRPTDAGLPLAVILVEAPTALISPILSKLYQESNLRAARHGAALHPDSARACGLGAGGRAALETLIGRCEVEVTVDPSVPPGAVAVAAGPEVLDICGAFARARVVRA